VETGTVAAQFLFWFIAVQAGVQGRLSVSEGVSLLIAKTWKNLQLTKLLVTFLCFLKQFQDREKPTALGKEHPVVQLSNSSIFSLWGILCLLGSPGNTAIAGLDKNVVHCNIVFIITFREFFINWWIFS
jgi:hypothetical protein